MENEFGELFHSGTFTFHIVGHPERDINLCLLPATADTSAFYEDDSDELKRDLSNPTELQCAGFNCDQVADDFRKGNELQLVKVFGSKEMSYNQFRRTVLFKSLFVKRITVQGNASSRCCFDNMQLEFVRYTPLYKSGSDYINVGDFVKQINKAVIDLEDVWFELDASIYMAITVPMQSDFFVTLDLKFDDTIWNGVDTLKDLYGTMI